MSAANIKQLCEDIISELHDRTKHLSIDKVLMDINEQLGEIPDFYFFVKQKKFFRTPDEPHANLEYLLLPYLSFKVINGRLVRYKSLDDCVLDYQHNELDECFNLPTISVCMNQRNYNANKDKLEAIANALHLFYHINVYDDMVDASAKKLTKLMVSSNEVYSVEDLLTYLAENYDEVEGLSLVTFTQLKGNKKIKCSSIENYGDDALKKTQLTEDMMLSAMYSYEKRRTSDGYEGNLDHIFHYAFIPVEDELGLSLQSAETFRAILIFSRSNEVNEFLIRFSSRGAKASSLAKRRHAQTKNLHDMARLERQLIARISAGELNNEIKRWDFIKPKVRSIVKSILHSTAAHSVTIRTYDAFNNNLVLQAEDCYPSSSYKSDEPVAYNTSNQNSINVQCFLTKEPGGYIYHPNLRSKITTPNPRNSESEACFPIWKGGVPFGTLNVEGHRKGILVDDIPFYSWVATKLGDLFTSLSNSIATEAIAQLSKANELVHGSLSDDLGRQAKLNFSQSDQAILKNWNKFQNEFRQPIVERIQPGLKSLRHLVHQEIKNATTSNELSKLNLNYILPEIDQEISQLEYENIQGIVKTLLSNAQSHSNLVIDFLKFFILERCNNRYFFIKYISKFGKLTPSEAKSYGTIPVVKEGKVRYGAFLMGQRVRAANGVLIINRPEQVLSKSIPLELVIGLPLGNYERNNSISI